MPSAEREAPTNFCGMSLPNSPWLQPGLATGQDGVMGMTSAIPGILIVPRIVHTMANIGSLPNLRSDARNLYGSREKVWDIYEYLDPDMYPQDRRVGTRT